MLGQAEDKNLKEQSKENSHQGFSEKGGGGGLTAHDHAKEEGAGGECAPSRTKHAINFRS